MIRVAINAFAGLCLLAASANSAASGDGPASYATPQDALEAMILALQDKDSSTAVLGVFGADAADILSSGNPQRDAANRMDLLELYSEGFRFQPSEDGSVVILLGAEAWPFPIPVGRGGDGWSFDIEAGRDEVFHRRIGLNELDVIEFMTAYVETQSQYRLVDHDGDQVMEFAQSFLSSEGARDGLFWNDPDSPLGIRIALASLDGYSDGERDLQPDPFSGYYFRILQGQGEAAPGGSLNYVVNGNMVAGHALIAVPSDYGNTGIHSFLVSENGVVLQADLGEDSLDTVFDTTVYNPGEAWSVAE